jgi:hypothetical protein
VARNSRLSRQPAFINKTKPSAERFPMTKAIRAYTAWPLAATVPAQVGRQCWTHRRGSSLENPVSFRLKTDGARYETEVHQQKSTQSQSTLVSSYGFGLFDHRQRIKRPKIQTAAACRNDPPARAGPKGEEMNVQKPLIASPPWTVEEEEQLRSLVVQGQTALEIGAQLQRTENAVQHRMTKLGLRSKRVRSTRLVEWG